MLGTPGHSPTLAVTVLLRFEGYPAALEPHQPLVSADIRLLNSSIATNPRSALQFSFS